MSSKAKLLLFALTMVMAISLSTGGSLWRAQTSQTKRNLIKQQAVELIQLPDLALTSEATWLRHRSLATPFSIFAEDGALLDYYPSSFVYKMILPQPKHR